MVKSMEFQAVHKDDSVDISGPDHDGEYCITASGRNDYCRAYVSRGTLAEIRAFLCELLDGDEE